MFCTQCGSETASDAKFCKKCGTATNAELISSTPSIQNNVVSGASVIEIQYADFWRRGAAAIVDFQMIGCGYIGLTRLIGDASNETNIVVDAIYFIFVAFIYSVYESRDSATLGKQLFYLSVLRTDKSKLSFAHALGRFLGRGISLALLGMGYLIQPFTPKKQALHDMMTGSVVVQNKKGREGLIVAVWIFQITLLAISISIFLYQDNQQKVQAIAAAQQAEIKRIAAAQQAEIERIAAEAKQREAALIESQKETANYVQLHRDANAVVWLAELKPYKNNLVYATLVYGNPPVISSGQK